MPAPVVLPRIGDGVVLRRLDAADLVTFQAYRHDPLVGRYQGWSARSDAEAAAFLAEMSGAVPFRPGVWFQLGIAAPESLALIGDIGLLLAADETYAEIGFTLRRESQGQGLARAAVREVLALLFESTAVARVIAVTDARNRASIRLLERVGMRRVASAHGQFRGEPCLEHTFALHRDVALGIMRTGFRQD